MKSHKCRIIAFLCLAALLLAGCNKETNLGPGAMGSEVWTDMPTLTYGKLESEKLEVLPWNSGRCEATHTYTMAETENGYYLSYLTTLFYSDKSNLGNWVPVCNNPDCTHRADELDCTADVSSDGFLIKDGRIIFSELTGSTPQLYTGLEFGSILVSMAPDGTNKQLVYVFEDGLLSTAGSHRAYLLPDQWVYVLSSMNKDGSYTDKFYRLTENGIQEIPLKSQIGGTYRASEVFFLHGETYFYCEGLSENLTRFEEDGIKELDLSLLPEEGGCVSGDTLRIFRQNDGYYDIDIKTGEEVKVANVRLKNSGSFIMLPNCIVETTLSWFAMDERTEGMTHAMEVFDGEAWRPVTLPEEMKNASVDDYIFVTGVTSDSILISWRNTKTYTGKAVPSVFYRIPLGTDELVMEYCGEIKLPV